MDRTAVGAVSGDIVGIGEGAVRCRFFRRFRSGGCEGTCRTCVPARRVRRRCGENKGKIGGRRVPPP